MNPYLIDAHSHLQFPQYDTDRDEVIERMFDKNIWTICSGSNSMTSVSAVELAEKYEKGIYAVIGIHPSHAENSDKPLGVDEGHDAFDYEKMLSLAKHPKVVGIGEAGFEFFDNKDSIKEQKELFEAHISLSSDIKKPLVIHCRNGYGETYESFVNNKSRLLNEPGIMHFYSGDKEYAKKFLDLGYSFTFGGALPLPKRKDGSDFAEVLAFIPKDRILLETDAPYVAPLKFRGRKNEPLYVEEVLFKASEILDIPHDELSLLTVQNTFRVFGL